MIAVLLLLQVAVAPPQSSDSADTSAIRPSALRRHVEVIAADSMLGRRTPGAGLERTARYVAEQFARLGLRPAGTAGGYEQRWGLARWVPDSAASRIALAGAGWRATPRLGADVRYVGGAVDGTMVEGEAVLVAADGGSGASPSLAGRVALLPVDYSRALPPELQKRVERLAAEAAAVVILSNRDSLAFLQRLESAAAPRLTADFRAADAGAPVLELHRRALNGREPADIARIAVRLERRVQERFTAPNLVGVLEGADSGLRKEFVVITAHLDGLGTRTGAGDSIFNGADDNATGVAALLEIARAFAERAARPRRSLLFLSASGEELGLWGSDYFVRHPTVPLHRIAALLNMDLIGRNWPDSVIVVGPEFTTLGTTLRRTIASHPELRMGAVADRWPEERIFYRSDHYHFARAGVPILFFTSGTHPDYHQPSDSPDRVDFDKATRVAQLVYRVAAAAANDPERPRWSPESYRRIVQEE